MKVVIVGGGPAGLITALNLCQQGLKPLVLERAPQIHSTACGEAVGGEWLKDIPFDSTPFIARRLKGAKLIFPGPSFDYVDKECVVLNRAAWLRAMAEEVERRGGEVWLNSTAAALEDNVIRLKDGENIGYDVLIGADGPHSFLAHRLGLKLDYITACQYQINLDTRDRNHLEFYFDKRFSYGYSWLFPKDGVANVGLAGSFHQLDAFLEAKGLADNLILKKEAGIIPNSGIGRLVWQNIALIGDAAAMPNPSGASGLSPVIQASRILADNITRLNRYESEVSNHPMASPVLLKGTAIMKSFTNRELASIGSYFSKINKGKGHAPYLSRIIRYPSLLWQFRKLWTVYRAGRMAMDFGW